MSLTETLYAMVGLTLFGGLFTIRGIYLALKVYRRRYLLLPIDRLDLQMAALAWLFGAAVLLVLAILLTLSVDRAVRP